MTDIKSIIDNNSETIRNAVSEKLSHLTSGTEDYITAWKALQDEAAVYFLTVSSIYLKVRVRILI